MRAIGRAAGPRGVELTVYGGEANSDFRLWVGTYVGVGGLLLLLLYWLVLRPLM